MARPKPDSDRIKARIISEAEAMLEASDGRRLVLSDIASRLDMSQSHIHTFFPTKADLIRSLASTWFAEVEAVSARAAHGEAPAAERLEDWVLSILRLMRARHDRNPALFLAYLELAKAHRDVVAAHVARLRADLTEIVRGLPGNDDLEARVQLVEDCTLLFRTPHNIALFRPMATDERARAVCTLLTGRQPLG